MELIIYFGMMPIILLFGMIAHKLDYPIMREFGDDDGAFGIVFVLAIWPLCLFALIAFFVCAGIYIVLERTAEGIVYLIRKVKPKDE